VWYSQQCGDHHAILIDIDLLSTIGEPCFIVIQPPGQCLNCILTFMWDKYLTLLSQYSTCHALSTKLNQLFALASSPTTTKDTLQMALEQFDWLKCYDMKFTEKRCHQTCARFTYCPLSTYVSNTAFIGKWLCNIRKAITSKQNI